MKRIVSSLLFLTFSMSAMHIEDICTHIASLLGKRKSISVVTPQQQPEPLEQILRHKKPKRQVLFYIDPSDSL